MKTKLHFIQTKLGIFLALNIFSIGLLLIGYDLPFYLCMIVNGIALDWRLYSYISKKTWSWQPFSLQVLGGLLDLIGIVLMVIGLGGFFMLSNPIAKGIFLFIAFLSFGLLMVGGALILRFRMKSGIIIYRGR